MTINELINKHERIAFDLNHAKLSIEFAISVLNECYQGLDPDNSTEEDIFSKIQELKTYLE